MTSSETTGSNISYCKICAQSGFPNVRICWKSVGEKEDRSPKWVPHEDEELNIRHTHRHLNANQVPAVARESLSHLPNTVTIDDASLFDYQNEYISNIDVMAALSSISELDQKRDRLLRELVNSIRYRSG